MGRFSILFAALALGACGEKAPEPPAPTGPTPQDADKFIADVNEQLRTKLPMLTTANWVQLTYITPDTERLAAKFNEEFLGDRARWVQEAKKYLDVPGLSPDTARALRLLKNVEAPAPSDPAKQAELAKILAKMEANYGSGKWCHKDKTGNDACLTLQEIEKIVNNVSLTNAPGDMADAWAGWHATAMPIRQDYKRFVELVNEGAEEMGFANAGELWRGGYDLDPQEFEAETERLWGQVKPLYEALHCHVRARLNRRYGNELVPENGLIPSHLLGNMWAQQWSNLYPLIEPFKGVSSLDVSATLRKQRNDEFRRRLAAFKGRPAPKDVAEIDHQATAAHAVAMVRIAEEFYTSLGFPALPESFWQRSLLVQPRDRDVQCHAAAEDIDMQGDVRIKQCIEPDEEQLNTIHHELGHVFYYLMDNPLPPLFQDGANDGFHEAIGDAVTLSLTPGHLHKVGLVPLQKTDPRATINAQMKWALDKIVLLPWGKLVDQWRWRVFAGDIAADQYTTEWWKLRAYYQGVAPPSPRGEDHFDPGAKYHVPANVPYTRYFLATILQFQFYKALCQAAGHQGPLHECDFHGNREAGRKYMQMMRLGASEPWPVALEKLTGMRQMDGGALIEYFAPLLAYLKEQNEGMACGWRIPEAQPPAPVQETPPPAPGT